MDSDTLLAAARQWIQGDPEPATRTELQQLVDAGDSEELADRMAGTLEFGTAGLRSRVQAGSNRMNRAVVIRASRGVADHVLSDRPNGDATVVIGRDARLSSAVFMEDTVGVLVAAGLRVRYFPDPVPTPLVAYAARRTDARMAIVVTASHNPPWDNGYKVFDQNGAQIVPPVDRSIAEFIDAVGPARDVPRVHEPYENGGGAVLPVARDMFDRYIADLASLRGKATRPRLRIVHTPLHGVGGAFVVSALTRLGGHELIPVLEQFEPDGRFPTVEFPNPEEPGALDLALEAAEQEGADLVLANDPDTDRLAVAVPVLAGGWEMLSGNQVGVLLGDWMLRGAGRRGERAIVINSIVSTPMLGRVAAHANAVHATTLTGFKWIWNAALDLERAGVGKFVFGFEEALGYSVTPFVRDKDGISAAVAFADLAAAARVREETIQDVLASLYRRHGLWISGQHSVVRPGADGSREIAEAVDRLSSEPPAALAGRAVTEIVDYRQGAERRPRYLGRAPLIEMHLEGGGRALARPSGTEPKLKIYVDLRSELDAGVTLAGASRALGTAAREAAVAVAAVMGLGGE